MNGAVIKIRNSNLGTISDSTGIFQLKVSIYDTISLNISYEGYKKIDTIIVSQNNDQGFLKLYLNYECDIISKEIALKDIDNNTIKLYIISGYTPIISTKQVNIDAAFQKEFNIVYEDVGDALPSSPFCMREYNVVIFKYLDNKFKDKWYLNVNKSVSGLENYILGESIEIFK